MKSKALKKLRVNKFSIAKLEIAKTDNIKGGWSMRCNSQFPGLSQCDHQ